MKTSKRMPINTVILPSGADYVSKTLAIIAHLVLITYITALQSTKCASDPNDWRPKFLLYVSLAAVALVPLHMYVRITPGVFYRLWNSGVVHGVLIFLLLLGALKAYVTVDYALSLYQNPCAEDWRRPLILWLGIFSVLVYVIMVLGGVITLWRRLIGKN